MPQTELEQLIDQLYESSGDPRSQKAVIRRMARLQDPKAIVELASIYHKDDGDPGVKRAAANALRTFRQIEQRLNNSAGSRQLTIPPGLLLRLRSVLVLLLILTVVGNAAVYAFRLLPPPPRPPQLAASKRDDLTALLKTRIDNARTNAAYLRQRWQDVQGNVTLTCPGKFVDVAKADIDPIDLKTYPDLPPLNDQLNAATEQVIQQRADWEGLCTDPKNKDVIARYAGADGAPGRIVEIDKILKLLEQAQIKFDAWVNNPAPTFAPSPTPITPTSVPPTITLTPTKGPTVTSSPMPTAAPSATITPLQGLTFDGAKLELLTSYAYKMTVKYEGVRNTGGTYNGVLVIQAFRSAKPLTAQSLAQYDVNLTEDEKLLAPLNSQFFIKGRVRYVLIGGNYYADVVTPPNAPCKAQVATDTLAANLDTLSPNIFLRFSGQALTRIPKDETINGFAAQHYHAEGKSGDGKATLTTVYDVYVTPDKYIPVRVAYTVTGPYNGVASIPANSHLTTFSVQYDLTQISPDLTPIKAPPNCPKPQ